MLMINPGIYAIVPMLLAGPATPAPLSCLAQACIPVCQTGCKTPAPKPAPKPCQYTPTKSVGEMVKIPADARALILESANAGYPTGRFAVLGGRVMVAGQELTDLRLPGGTTVSPLPGKTGSVYSAAGYYVLRYDGCLPWLMASSAVDPAGQLPAFSQTPGMAMKPPGARVQAQAKTSAPASAPVPEPASWLLVAMALAVLAISRRVRP